MQDLARLNLIVMLTGSIVLSVAAGVTLWIAEHGLVMQMRHLWLVAPTLGVLVFLIAVWVRDELRKLP